MTSQVTDAIMRPSHSRRAASILALAGILTLACFGVIDPVPSTTRAIVVVRLDGLTRDCSVIGGNARSVRVAKGPSSSPVAISFSVSCVADGSGAGNWDY